MEQVFTGKMLREKYLERGGKLFVASLATEKAYDRIRRKGLWDVMRQRCGRAVS